MRVRSFSDTGIKARSWVQLSLETIIVPAILSLCAFGLWFVSLQHINLRDMNDLGLISVLPPTVFVALGLVTISFCLVLRQKAFNEFLLFAHVLILIMMLYGVITMVEEVPRFHVTWRHVGISEYITRTGDVDPRLNAYFNWPGFFVLTSFMAEISGFSSTLELAVWATVFFNLVYFGPLMLIFRSATTNRRVAWLGIWLFYITDWIGQDYFAPQALNYFLYLVLLAIVLTWLRSPNVQLADAGSGKGPVRFGIKQINRFYNWIKLTDLPQTMNLPGRRAGMFVVAVLIYAAMVPSHQITPVVAIGCVLALVVLNRCDARTLPVVMGVIFVAWLAYMTTAYLSGHFDKVVGSVGKVTTNVSANVTSRLRGSSEHLFVVQMRLIMTAMVVGLAGLGGFLRWRNGYRDVSLAMLTLVPFVFVIIQPYGGEMLLRAYLFALPGLVFFVASIFYPSHFTWLSTKKTLFLALVCSTLLVSFLITRYGNERMDVFSEKEAEAVEQLYHIAPPNALLIAPSDYLPWKYEGYGVYRYKTVTREVRDGQLDDIIKMMASKQYSNSYFIITHSQKAFFELFIGFPPGDWEQFEASLFDSKQFQVVYSNPDAVILTLTPDARANNR